MVAVIIPVFHSKDTLPAALDSLVAQTKKMFMTIIVNDADGEDYSDIIEEYKRRGLKIWYLEQEENGGPGLARQRGIDACTMCEYIMFLDSDDMYYPRAVEVLTRSIQQSGYDIIMGNFVQEETAKPLRGVPVKILPITWTHGKIYRRQYLIDNNIRFPKNLRVSEDCYFNMVAWNATDNRTRLEENVYIWRDNKHSLTREDGQHIFDIKNIDAYVTSQVMALKKLKEIRGNIPNPVLTQDLLNIYNQVQKTKVCGADESTYIDELKSLRELEEIQEWENDFENWEYIMEKSRQGIITQDKDIIFFRERFIDWFERMFKS